MRAVLFQAAGAVLVVTGFALLAPFAGFLAAGVLLVTFGIAIEREG